jgi:hypothetical protein
MAEVLHVFEDPILLNGVPYTAQVAGRPDGHIWEGWIEFAADDGSDLLRTPRETTQPDRAALIYWATGLSGTYLEGALRRALDPPLTRVVSARPEALFDAPAPSTVAEVYPVDRAVLDPFSVGAKGEDLLRRELGALRGWHLRNIIRAYQLASDAIDLEAMNEPALVELIVAAVRATERAERAGV